MPVISIVLSEEEHSKLQDEYKKMTSSSKTLPPSYEQWLSQRAIGAASMPENEPGDIRVFHAIEKLVTSLHLHGFSLAHIGKPGVASPPSALELAQVIITDIKLQPQYLKRIQDLIEHYLKSAKDIADAANIGVTNRARDGLVEAYEQLVARTAKALESLGGERAIGRVEGGAAILVSLDVMDRDSAKKKSHDFKVQARTAPRPGWMGKVFRGADEKG